jgi:SAM-dependent methyltransferase
VGDPGYAFAYAPDDEERARLDLLEGWAGPLTTRQLGGVPLQPGWRCLDVGAGGGSVTRQLSAQVGSNGTVVATDRDPRFLVQLPANVEVRTHDVARDELEAGHYDLVHTRLLLMHLAEPAAVLARLVAALRPGGWLVVAEADWGLTTFGGHPEAGWATAFVHDLFARHERAGIRRPYFGRELPGLVAACGLDDVTGDFHGTVALPGSPSLDLIRRTIATLRPAGRAVGASEAELDRLAAVLDAPGVLAAPPVLVGMRGRRPG